MVKILKITDGVLKNRNRKRGNAIPALIEDTDTMPVTNKTIRKMPEQLKVKRG
jgi:hypothetical protein